MKPHEQGFVIEDYARKAPFSSFLPGLCDLTGIPVWSFYVNRGQAIASFGAGDKEHSIMEFFPAHQSYQNVKTTGFRTFVKADGRVVEPFADETLPHRMRIFMNALEIETELPGLRVRASYFTLPGERLGALARTLTIENAADHPLRMEVLDGMSALIPSGVSLSTLKAIGQTARAWMQVEDVERRTPYFRVRASMDDSAEVSQVEAGHFALGFDEQGAPLPMLVDPSLVFAYDTSLRRPVSFEGTPLAALLSREQVTANEFPCCFFAREGTLAPGEAMTVCSLYGRAESKARLAAFCETPRPLAYFAERRARADAIAQELTGRVETHTASPAFDAYCRYNFMDNLLRGGYPIRLGKDKVFYAYSRKHGDLERDYNFFSMLPEYYSQGNGNYRDVNQNRRCDVFFAPFVGRENIDKFMSLIQLDGYNPLKIEQLYYRLSAQDAERILGKAAPALVDVAQQAFTPGQLAMALEDATDAKTAARLFGEAMDASEAVPRDAFGEGYWSDHWTYNLDLIEEYLQVYPDRERALMLDETLTCFAGEINVNPRRKRCVETPKGLRQYRALDERSRRSGEAFVRAGNSGEPLKLSLLEKLAMLCAVKFATLDAYGMGVEMEGGKPGWYDALNGLPGRFGSSMNEAYELARLLRFTANACAEFTGALPVLCEIAQLLRDLYAADREHRALLHACDGAKTREQVLERGEVMPFYNRINDIKEAYRAKVFGGVSGEKTPMGFEELDDILSAFESAVECGMRKAAVLGGDTVPAYFAYDVTEYRACEDGIEALHFAPIDLPPFLEGAVRRLKLGGSASEKRALYDAVRSGPLYDRKLRMYKVNASLSAASYELGRAVAFVPGWLENESVWLHMEYKYLLELLRAGLYREFFADLRDAAVPFLDPDVYGRSIYENSSFIVSSAYPNAALHGKGFVARLSGSTVEFISMLKGMMFGPSVLRMEGDALLFTPEPALPEYLIPEDGRVGTTLFGDTRVEYRFAKRQDYIPGEYRILGMDFFFADGTQRHTDGRAAGDGIAEALREGRVREVVIAVE